jgi:hypothetical protein
VFDITCFTGISQYHTIRTEGQCSPCSLSSIHIRAVDFELMCAPDPDCHADKRKEDFEKQTRDKFQTALTYMASIDLAYENEQNHDSITPSSFSCLQATRENFKRVDTVELDPAADIVTIIIDTVTDKRHLHFVKAGTSASTDAYFNKVLLLRVRVCTACTPTPDSQLIAY